MNGRLAVLLSVLLMLVAVLVHTADGLAHASGAHKSGAHAAQTVTLTSTRPTPRESFFAPTR